MSSHELPVALQLKPIISYPRQAQVGQTYLVSIDVQLATPNAPWDFPEEEYTIGFLLNTSPYFTCEPLHDVWPTVILHRYGGTYGPAEFLFTAAEHEIERGQISITLVNGWGIPMTRLELPCEVSLESNLQSTMPEIILPSSQDTAANHNGQTPIPVSREEQEEQEEQERVKRLATMLAEAGWTVMDISETIAPQTFGIAIRIHPYGGGIEYRDGSVEYHDFDFLLLVNGEAAGLIIREEIEIFISEVTLIDGLINRSRNPLWSSLIRSVREPLPFVYVMHGEEIHFTNHLEPEARSRTIFHFHRPETFALWLEQAPVGTPNDLNDLLRSRLRRMPPVSDTNVPANLIEAITKLEASLAQNRLRAMIQMTDSLPMIIDSMSRLIEYGGARNILFIAKNIEDQEILRQKLMSDINQLSNRTLIAAGISFGLETTNELWVIQHSPDHLDNIYITNLDYLHRILSESYSDIGNSDAATPIDMSIVYQPRLPIDAFDIIFFVECFDELPRRYRPLLDYFDAFLVGVGADIPVQVETLFNRNIVYKLRNRIFICYSHVDREFLERLQIHLIYAHSVSKLSAIDIWDDTKIQAGADWREEIEKSLQLTRVAILLVSADFLAANFIREFELPLLLQGARQREVSIILVIVRPCLLTYTPLAQFQSFNNPSTPLAAMEPVRQEETWGKIARAALNAMSIVPAQVEEAQNEVVEPSWQVVSEDTANSTRHRIFISLSHKDKTYLERLSVHLMGYKYASSTSLDIDIWDDTKISSTPNVREEIGKALQATKIAILLVSADFFASDDIREQELPLLLQVAKEGNITISSLIIGPCPFSHTELSHFKTFNDPALPLLGMPLVQQEGTWAKVAETIWEATGMPRVPQWQQEETENKVIAAPESSITLNTIHGPRTHILIIYSFPDIEHLNRLQTHLNGYIDINTAPLNVDIWGDDTKTSSEANTRAQIEQTLQSTKIAILLVSADFLASDFINEDILPLLLKEATQHNITILCVMVGPCAYMHTSLANFQLINDPHVPLLGMSPHNKEVIWAEVAKFAYNAISAQS